MIGLTVRSTNIGDKLVVFKILYKINNKLPPGDIYVISLGDTLDARRNIIKLVQVTEMIFHFVRSFGPCMG